MPMKLSLTEILMHRLHVLPTPVMDGFGAVIFARALTVALRRGVFESTAAGSVSLGELSGKTGLAPEGARLLADACAAGGYLHERNGMYTATREAKKWLVRSSPTYLGDLMLYFDSLNSRLGGLERSLEHGKPARPYYASFGEEEWKTYVRGMANLARLLIPEVIRKIRLPRSGGQILDLGGSHGLYSLACCRRFPGTTAIVMDFAQALHQAEALLEGEAGNRIQLIAGDILTSPLPPDQDAVLLFNILHGFDGETNRTLIARASASLRRGGRLYILDQMAGTGQRSPLSRFMPLMVGLNLMNEVGGSAHPLRRIREWCSAARSFRAMPLRFPGVALIEAADWSVASSR